MSNKENNCEHINPVDALVAKRMMIPASDLSQTRLVDYQLEMLRRTLKYVKDNSSYYREVLSTVDPEDIRSIDDLKSLPMTEETDLAGNEWRFQCIPSGKVSRIVTVPTSGTSGQSKHIAFSEQDMNRAAEFIYRGFLTMRCCRNEKMLIYMSGNSPGSIGDLVNKAMQPLGMQIFVHGAVTDIREAYERMLKLRPEVIEGIPWHMAALARYGTRYGNPEREFIRSVNLSADFVPESIVERIRSLWDCTVHIHYGMTEMCIFGGVECEYRKGLHVRGSDMIYEVADADQDGYGEIIITTLNREAMPLIRYRTGDIGRITTEPCRCGSDLYRIEKLVGRKKDVIETNGYKLYFSDLADALYSIPEIIDFDVELNKSMGEELPEVFITVRILPGESISNDAVVRSLISLPAIRLLAGDHLYVKYEETESFPGGYNLKKRVKRKNNT